MLYFSQTDPNQERKAFANKLKAAGNTAYGDKRYNDAIQLYNKAILCRPDPIYYSNRAACQNALGEYEKCVEDTTAALAMDGEYIKALNRRASAYESLKKHSEALIDYTASCIIDGFRNETAAQSVERLLKKVAEAKAKARFEGKERRLPNATFITHYLDSFRPRPLPPELDESAELEEDSGKGQLRAGLQALRGKSADGYATALQCYNKAIELGNLGELEGLAYQWRGTFRFLLGVNADALTDLTKSIELQSVPVEALIKRASVHIEIGKFDLQPVWKPITADAFQVTKMRQRKIWSRPSSRIERIRTSTITVASWTSSSMTLLPLLRTTSDPLTWTKTSCTPISSSV